MKFPKKIFVYVDENGDEDPVLLVADSIKDIPEQYADTVVGFYELRETKRFVVNKSARWK